MDLFLQTNTALNRIEEIINFYKISFNGTKALLTRWQSISLLIR